MLYWERWTVQSTMKRIRHYDQLPGDLFRQVDVQRAGASVFQAEETAWAKARRWEGAGCAFNDPKRASVAEA